jgi:hypothetical protein
MAYTPISTAGEKLYISSTPSGSATLEILGIETLDRVGGVSESLDRTTMRDTSKRKGKAALEDAGTVSLAGLWSNQDAGQQMLKTARNSASAYNFKIELNDASALGLTNNTTLEFSAFVMGFDLTPGGNTGADLRFSSNIDIDGNVSETLPS